MISRTLNIIDFSFKRNGPSLTTYINENEYEKVRFKHKFLTKTWHIYKLNVKQPILTLKYVSRLFKLDYQINVEYQEENILFNYIAKKPHITFEHKDSKFLIVFHKNNIISFFKGEVQFAHISKNRINISGTSKLEGILNTHLCSSDFFLNLCYILILDNYSSDDDWDSDFTIDLRSLGRREYQKSNPNWYLT